MASSTTVSHCKIPETKTEPLTLDCAGTGLDGIGWGDRASNAYVAVISILVTQYTIMGFDASAHMSEETTNAAWSAPMGVIMSVGASALLYAASLHSSPSKKLTSFAADSLSCCRSSSRFKTTTAPWRRRPGSLSFKVRLSMSPGLSARLTRGLVQSLWMFSVSKAPPGAFAFIIICVGHCGLFSIVRR
ncbi:hypothetical protein [Paraburkholderia sp.]|uniref:hypothetical protein n=1 Tax=Paraburkholderia sp. TaxID=1926495 RepID=UPI002398D61A|nr:hypothetical protein [Paraburkholderia sp.]MDE1181960.1 hypothetical protein [Paraburkholderia sp.]